MSTDETKPPVADPRETAKGLVIIKALQEAAKGEDDRLRPQMLESLDNYDQPSQNVKLADGTLVGSVSHRDGSESPRIVDEKAFFDWVVATRPKEIIEVVRESYKKSVLKGIKKNGELPPGVEMRYGDPGTTVTLKPGGREAVLAAIVSGELPLAITAGPQDEDPSDPGPDEPELPEDVVDGHVVHVVESDASEPDDAAQVVSELFYDPWAEQLGVADSADGPLVDPWAVQA